MHRYLILALLLASVAAHAATSLRVGNKVLTLGDSAARVLELMGQPTIRTFEHQQAGGLPNNQLASGEQWQYAKDGKTIVITVVGGRVTNLKLCTNDYSPCGTIVYKKIPSSDGLFVLQLAFPYYIFRRYSPPTSYNA
jgi:hypothetical protein